MTSKYYFVSRVEEKTSENQSYISPYIKANDACKMTDRSENVGQSAGNVGKYKRLL